MRQIESEMDVDNTNVIPFILKYNSNNYTGGLCISSLELDYLKDIHKAFLHPIEQAYFNNLQFTKRQHSYLLGRYCAKQAILMCATLGSPNEILIEKGIFEQPITYHPCLINTQVSISHCDRLGIALAFPEACPMAIDIETIELDKHETFISQLTTHEKKLKNAFSSNIPPEMFWTMKEALSKALKCGLTTPFELLEVECISMDGALFVARFKNFSQYLAISFFISKNVCSIVYPKNVQLEIDLFPSEIKFCDL